MDNSIDNNFDFFKGNIFFERKLLVSFIQNNYQTHKGLIFSKEKKYIGSRIVCYICSNEFCSYKIICRKSLSITCENQPFIFSELQSNLNHGIFNELGNQYGFCTADNQKPSTVMFNYYIVL